MIEEIIMLLVASNDISDNNIPQKTTDLLATTRNEPILTSGGLTATTSLEMHVNDTHGKMSEINHGNGELDLRPYEPKRYERPINQTLRGTRGGMVRGRGRIDRLPKPHEIYERNQTIMDDLFTTKTFKKNL